MPDADPRTVTQLLSDWREGDAQAMNRLIPLVYDELRRMARGLMRSERSGHTLQATALVHEAYDKLVDQSIPASDRGQFLAIASTAMRQILVDHARARKRAKRGGGAVRVTLGEDLLASSDAPDTLLQIDEALSRLEELDPRKRRALELSLFAGLTQREIAEVLGVSVPTVERDLRMARAWIRSEMDPRR